MLSVSGVSSLTAYKRYKHVVHTCYAQTTVVTRSPGASADALMGQSNPTGEVRRAGWVGSNRERRDM